MTSLFNREPDSVVDGIPVFAARDDYVANYETIAADQDLHYAPGTFDLVLATDVLEHVLDLNEAVGAMLRVLRLGGILIARSPNEEDLYRPVEINIVVRKRQ